MEPKNVGFISTHAESADGLSGAPDLLSINLVELLLEVLAVGLASVELERAAGLGSILDRGVKSLEHGAVGSLELGGPVEGTTAGGGCERKGRLALGRFETNGRVLTGAGGEHVVHA